jgi:UDP-N-acetylmuramoyl-tripeptide--D-alanyl-D-alanine ligase
VTFGFAAEADIRAAKAGDAWRFATPAGAFDVKLRVAGEHNVSNALAACAAAHALGVPPEAMLRALAAFAGVPGRLQRRRGPGGWVVIDDTYNANPESMKAAIDVLVAETGRRVLVMGDMGELGTLSAQFHAEVGEYARRAGVDALLATGEASRHAVDAFGAGARHYESAKELAAAAAAEARAGATLVVKGSRFMQMERVAEAILRGDHDAL